jgi:hypothetical protein
MDYAYSVLRQIEPIVRCERSISDLNSSEIAFAPLAMPQNDSSTIQSSPVLVDGTLVNFVMFQ